MRSVGVIGLGSIGRRHVRLLKALVPDVRIHAYRTKRGGLNDPAPDVVEVDRDAFFSSKFDLVVIANPSSLHLQTLREVIEASLAPAILVEKPFCLPGEAADAARLLSGATARVLPGNCLRFHPAIDLLKDAIAGGTAGEVLECHAHFGTYMPGWHPYEDYRTTYAARRDMGGGVLATSIHEIDLVHHLFGDGRVAAACVGQLSLHETDVEDSAHVLLRLERCRLANISLNFFERPADRFVKIVFERGVWSWTFGEPSVLLTTFGDAGAVRTAQDVDPGVDAMYVNMWRALLAGRSSGFEMGSVFASLKTIDSARTLGEAIPWN